MSVVRLCEIVSKHVLTLKLSIEPSLVKAAAEVPLRGLPANLLTGRNEPSHTRAIYPILPQSNRLSNLTLTNEIKGAGGWVKDRETERLVDNMRGDEKAGFLSGTWLSLIGCRKNNPFYIARSNPQREDTYIMSRRCRVFHNHS